MVRTGKKQETRMNRKLMKEEGRREQHFSDYSLCSPLLIAVFVHFIAYRMHCHVMEAILQYLKQLLF